MQRHAYDHMCMAAQRRQGLPTVNTAPHKELHGYLSLHPPFCRRACNISPDCHGFAHQQALQGTPGGMRAMEDRPKLIGYSSRPEYKRAAACGFGILHAQVPVVHERQQISQQQNALGMLSPSTGLLCMSMHAGQRSYFRHTCLHQKTVRAVSISDCTIECPQ